jgi:uncharacterized protein YigE (DUF2233 family)
MRFAVLLFLLLAACRGSEVAEAAPQSPCVARNFEGSRFTVCGSSGAAVEIRTSDRSGKPYRSFAALGQALGKRADRVAFAMNAGMFGEDGHAIGLLIEDGRQIHAINRREGGGNFHLLPNGVFLVRKDGRAAVVTSANFKPSSDIAFATQSGPMLVIDGKLHPAIEPDGQSRHIRNGVGIGPGGTALFVISGEPVSFGKLARLFRDELHANNALYFDGSVSSLWDPANGRQDAFTELGPIVVAFRTAESGPGRGARARP